MRRLERMIELVKNSLDIDSDTVLAAKVGIRKQELYRAKQTSVCSDVMLEKIAKAAGIPYRVFWLSREVDRAKTPGIRAEVEDLLKNDKAGGLYYRKLCNWRCHWNALQGRLMAAFLFALPTHQILKSV